MDKLIVEQKIEKLAGHMMCPASFVKYIFRAIKFHRPDMNPYDILEEFDGPGSTKPLSETWRFFIHVSYVCIKLTKIQPCRTIQSKN
jgi:hypothetical protein